MDAARLDSIDPIVFLDWVGAQEQRYELVDGLIVLMAGASLAHSVFVNNVTVALTPFAKRCGCRSTTSDTAVRTGAATIRFPDVVVDCGPADLTSPVAQTPKIVVEVSSPGTAQVDAVVKLDEYRRLATIDIVIQIEPEFVLVSVHRRNEQGGWTTQIHQSLTDAIDLAAIDATLVLSDIYDTIDVKPRAQVRIVP